VHQPRILVLDPLGPEALPYGRLAARLQPLEVRVETSLDRALMTLARDAWDLGVVTARSGPSADVLYRALRKADPQIPMVVIDPRPTVDTARACLQAGAGDYLAIDRVDTDLEDALGGPVAQAEPAVLQQHPRLLPPLFPESDQLHSFTMLPGWIGISSAFRARIHPVFTPSYPFDFCLGFMWLALRIRKRLRW
jgi:hypothetical protein